MGRNSLRQFACPQIVIFLNQNDMHALLVMESSYLIHNPLKTQDQLGIILLVPVLSDTNFYVLVFKLFCVHGNKLTLFINVKIYITT